MNVVEVLAPEADLLAVARVLFEPGTREAVAPIVRRTTRLPPRLGEGAMRALKNVLAKGLVRWLARAGARVSTHVRPDGAYVTGRAWELCAPPPLHLSPASFELLRWLVATPLGIPGAPAAPDLAARTLADELVAALAHGVLLEIGLEARAREPVFASSAFVWLAAGGALAEPARLPPPEAFAPWTFGPGADLCWMLAPWLSARWLAARAALADERDLERRASLGAAQGAVLARLVEPMITGGRPDALGFLFEVLVALIPAGDVTFEPARLFPGGLASAYAYAPLSLRARARRAAIAPLAALAPVSLLRDRARWVGFVDDEYEHAQRVLRLLDPWDDGRFDRAADVVRLAEQLPPSEETP